MGDVIWCVIGLATLAMGLVILFAMVRYGFHWRALAKAGGMIIIGLSGALVPLTTLPWVVWVIGGALLMIPLFIPPRREKERA